MRRAAAGRRAVLRFSVLLGAFLGVLAVATAGAPAPAQLAGVVATPIDPRYQTALGFGDRSHWLQPWRGYLDTPPATSLQRAVGINFNVTASQAPAVARLLAANGFRRARVEVGWNAIAYSNPRRLVSRAFEARLTALRDHGIRPLILLNANHGAPGPVRRLSARIVAPARAGSRSVRLDAATARAVVPGRTGLDARRRYKAAAILFTAVDRTGRARLSKPLPRRLAAGRHPATTLRYRPFGPPRLSDGRANPEFEATLRGWLAYAAAVADRTRRILGSTSFDLEIWNELSFGSDFLDVNTYYAPRYVRGRGDVTEAILERTLERLRRPARGLDEVRIANGFASQSPWASGATEPAGLDAISRHYYPQNHRFPRDRLRGRPLDAEGRVTASRQRAFTPTYDAFFPEYFLTGIITETIVRDLSPITTEIYGTPHGRSTAPRGGEAPGVWITEFNIESEWARRRLRAPLGPRDVEHLRAKSTLRALTAFVNKGLEQIDFFAAADPAWAIVGRSFFARLHSGRGYPGDDAGGAVTTAVGRLTDAVGGATALGAPRPLSLLSIGDYEGNVQFAGDGTPAHPPLYNRDVLAFLPFQVTDDRFVIPVHVMTRNLAKQYTGAPNSDPRRFDLPAERYRLTIGGARSERATVGATDPLTGESVPVDVVSREDGRLVVELPVTDSPRLLTIDD